MAIARVFECRGWTAEQYGELLERMGYGDNAAPGVLFHWATISDDGIRATDVYESQEAADRLANEEIGPIAGQMGLEPPAVTQFDVLRYLEPAGSA